jgi:hypothetical protein
VTDSLTGKQKTDSYSVAVPIGRMPPAFPQYSTSGGTTLTSGGEVTRRDKRVRRPGDDYWEDYYELSNPFVNIDWAPQIGELREESLGITRELLSDTGAMMSRLRGGVPETADILAGSADALAGNPFYQARIQPVLRQMENVRREAGRRGVSGPLAEMAVNPLRSEVMGQRAQAEIETLAAEQTLRGFQQSLAQDISGEAQRVLAQELAALGLSNQVIGLILESMMRTTDTGAREESRGSGGILDSVGVNIPIGG